MAKKANKYWVKLNDPRWQKRRLEIMARDDFRCISCDSNETTLHVHHFYYITGRLPWQYPGWALNTLCEDCHNKAHEYIATEITEWEGAMDFLLGSSGHDRMISSLWWLAQAIAMKGGDPSIAIDYLVKGLK